MKDKMHSFKDLAQTPEQKNMVEYNNMVQLLNRISSLEESVRELVLKLECSQNTNNSYWLDIKKDIKDILFKKPEEKEEKAKAPRRSGLQENILKVLQESYPESLHTWTILQRVNNEAASSGEPGYPENSVRCTLSKLESLYKIKRVARGVYIFPEKELNNAVNKDA